jgi:hypothetical protein
MKNAKLHALPGYVLVATGHAHPFTKKDLAKGATHGPSDDDTDLAVNQNVPGLIYDAAGILPYGRDFRRRLDNGDLYPTAP